MVSQRFKTVHNLTVARSHYLVNKIRFCNERNEIL